MKGSVIYKIKALTGGEIYIGSASNYYGRVNAHKNLLKRKCHTNKILQHHVNKYGLDDLVFSILEVVMFKEDLIIREQFYIDALKPKFNICPKAASRLGTKHSEETRSKMRGAWEKREFNYDIIKKAIEFTKGVPLTEEHKRKIRESKKEISAETREKMSISLKGKIPSRETRDKMRKAKIGNHLSEAGKQKLRDMWAKRKKEGFVSPNKGKTWVVSEETKIKLSIALKGRKLTPEHIEKTAATKRGKPLSEKHKQKIKDTLQDKRGGITAEQAKKDRYEAYKIKKRKHPNGYKATQETKNKMSESIKNSWRQRKNI